MPTKAASFFAVLILAFFTTAAQAYVRAPTIVPPHPKAGELVSVSIEAGICDGFVEGDPHSTKIFRKGNAIRILLEAGHTDTYELCNFPIRTTVMPVGMFPSDAYTLQVDRHYEGFIDPPEVTETLAILPFLVGSGAPIPAMGIFGALMLTILLAGAARIGLPRLATSV